MTTISASPCAGRNEDGHNTGRNSIIASALPGTPRGISNQKAPIQASTKAASEGSGSHSRVAGEEDNHSRPRHNHSMQLAAICHRAMAPASQTKDDSKPARESGTTTRLMTGMPTRLAIGPESEACPKNQIVSGSRPSTATLCASTKDFSSPDSRGCGRHQTSQATPMKLSQNPGVSTDKGSNRSTTIKASAMASWVRCGRPSKRSSATAAIISRVRTVGSANPANAE